MKNKLLLGLADRLVELLEEEEDIFFEERTFLENTDIPLEERKIISQDERRKQNELEIKKTAEAINKLVKKVPAKTPVGKQEGLHGIY